MEITTEMIYAEALALQDAVARLRVETQELELIMERIEAMGPAMLALAEATHS